MNERSLPILVALLLSGCFTPSLRTGEISNSPQTSVVLAGQFASEKDPFVNGAPIDKVPHAIAALLSAVRLDFGFDFFQDDSKNGGIRCGFGIALSAIQQDIHPRCGILQETKGDPVSIAVGYKISINSLFGLTDESAQPEYARFLNGHMATIDFSSRLGATTQFLPIAGIEIGQTIIPKKIEVTQRLDRNQNEFSDSLLLVDYEWAVKPTFGFGFGFDDENARHTVLTGATPIFSLGGEPAYRGVEISVGYQFNAIE